MENFCIVLSKVVHKEIYITAVSENEAMDKARQLYESGAITFDDSDADHVNVHPKY